MSNFTNPGDSVSSLPTLFEYANSVTNNVFGYMSLFAVWMIIFLALSQYPKSHGFATASFLTLILSALFWVGGAVDGFAVLILSAATILSGLYLVTR